VLRSLRAPYGPQDGKRVPSEEPIPLCFVRRFPPYHEFPDRPKISSACSVVLPSKSGESRSPYHARASFHVFGSVSALPRGTPLLSHQLSIAPSDRRTSPNTAAGLRRSPKMIAVTFLCQVDPIPPQPCLFRLVQDIEGDADRVLKDRAVCADPRKDAQAVQGVD